DNKGVWSDEVTTTLTVEASVEVPSGVSVILTFDDGFKSDYDIVYPELQARNMRSTHYIIASMVGADSTRMTWNDMEEMYAHGFDMECHSNTHPELIDPSTNVSDEMLKVNEAFEANGLPAPKHTAYPFGEYNDDVISIVSQYRNSGRVVSWGDNASYPIESLKKPYELPCYPTDFNNTITEIDKAIAGNYTLILGFHQISESRSGTYEMSISEFVSILDYIQSKSIPTQTISEYYKEKFENPNVAPVASIDMITPNPANQGDLVYFKGNGTDDGGAIKAYLWTLDGNELSTEASFITSTSDIIAGTHNIAFSVQDNDGAWSNEATETLTIHEPETPVEVPSGTTVVLTFNGGRQSDYDIAYTQLKERNITSTHYIIASMVGEDETRMTWDEIKAMYDDGFDMECNANTFSSFIDPSTNVSDQMLKVNEAFEAHGMPAPRHTAYPYGEYNADVMNITAIYRDSGRSITWQNSGYYPVDSLKMPYELPCYPTEYHGSIDKIDDAIAGNYTLILGFNHVTENPGDFDISVAEFVSILNYIESNKIPTQTISEYYEENLNT
ncbi:polysaccharide deacetylase family protein, partial [Methanolobus sp.]|uniref:polysaccharide deacetylase family protein n=1 Tax=Methanolobus sp. TaxID=1874737 RepID=UPI0025E8A0A3